MRILESFVADRAELQQVISVLQLAVAILTAPTDLVSDSL
jgi:hypothetical protein